MTSRPVAEAVAPAASVTAAATPHAAESAHAAPADAAPGIAARLREATMAEHRHAESRPFIADLMGGRLDLAEYTRYLAQLARIYEALEARPVREGEPEILGDRALHRAAAISSDLTALSSPRWRLENPSLPQTDAYVAHLGALAADDHVRFLAHHYTRYLGDLSGGQVMATMLRRHYGAADDQLTFFRFDGIDNLVHYKRAYRSALDALDVDQVAVTALVAEAKRAFDYNAAIFDALGATRA